MRVFTPPEQIESNSLKSIFLAGTIDEFYRSGNVQIVCDRYNIPLYKDFDKLLNRLRDEIK